MYYLVSVGQSVIAALLTRKKCERFQEVLCMQWMGLMMIFCGMAVQRLGMLGESVREMNELTVKMETVELIGDGGQSVTCFVY